MEKEIELLSRVAANHLFLGQFEALRASLLSLRKRRPELALAFLRKIVSEGGKIDGVLWSTTCRSPSHLAWLSVLELLEFGPTAPSLPSFDPEILRLKVEFLLLVQVVSFGVSESLQQKPLDSDRGADSLRILNQILQLGLQRLKKDVANDVELVDVIPSFTEEELRTLRGTFVDHAEVFDALCWNISRQIQFAEPHVSELAITVRNEAEEGVDSPHEGLEALAWIPREVQMAHLCALKESLKAGDAHGAIPHLRFLHFGYGVEETEYKMALEELIKMCWSHVSTYGELWQDIRNKVKSMYTEALSSNCIQAVQMIQAIQDGVLAKEIEQHRVSDNLIPLPLQKYLKTLTVNEVSSLESESAPIRSCIRDLYHYARISGTHVLECVMDTALSAVKREQLQEASDVLSLFPLLQPLVAVLGWDLLSGKTPVRRKLMQLLWTSKSHVSRLEEYSLYRKQSDEVSCVEYLCDLLCFHLDLSYFVACVNSGRPWNSKVSLTSPLKDYGIDEKDIEEFDPFVENFILERLAVQSPMRVLFDVVPGIRFQDAIELISLQPVDSTSAAWKRMQDIELMHMRYALESTVLALGSMEKCVGDETENQFCMAMLLLKDLRSHIEAITNGPRKVLMVSIITSLMHMDTLSADLLYSVSSSYYSVSTEHPDFTTYEGGNKAVISFTGCLLDILHRNLPAVVPELEHTFSSSLASAVRQALEWRLSNIKQFIEDWEWRLSILQRLEPLSEHPWSWREALVILRAAPSKLLNLCLQRAKYDIGEEAVHRFSLPPEDKAALELAEWVAGAFKKASWR